MGFPGFAFWMICFFWSFFSGPSFGDYFCFLGLIKQIQDYLVFLSCLMGFEGNFVVCVLFSVVVG